MDTVSDHIAIIGKGMIGIGFAALLTGNGFPVTVFAKNAPVALERYNEIFAYLEAQKLITSAQWERCRSLLCFTESYAELKDTQIVLECITEDLAVKQKLYAELEAACPHLVAIASASSAISPDELCAGMNNKSLLLVAHPYNPVYLVPCVEIVPGRCTSREAMVTVCALMEKLGRETVVMKKAAPGFIANRLQHALIREALHMVEQGIAEPADIDRALKTSFMPRYTSIGLLENIDNAGLDLEAGVEDYLFPELGCGQKAPAIMRERISQGDLGAKSGRGFYDGWTREKVQELHRRAAAPYLSYFNWNLPET